MRLSIGNWPARWLAWSMVAAGLGLTSAGLWAQWGWPAAALYLGLGSTAVGVLVAAVIGAAGKGGR